VEEPALKLAVHILTNLWDQCWSHCESQLHYKCDSEILCML